MLKTTILTLPKIFFAFSLFHLLLSSIDGRKNFNLNSNKWKNLMQ